MRMSEYFAALEAEGKVAHAEFGDAHMVHVPTPSDVTPAAAPNGAAIPPSPAPIITAVVASNAPDLSGHGTTSDSALTPEDHSLLNEIFSRAKEMIGVPTHEFKLVESDIEKFCDRIYDAVKRANIDAWLEIQRMIGTQKEAATISADTKTAGESSVTK